MSAFPPDSQFISAENIDDIPYQRLADKVRRRFMPTVPRK